MSLCPQTKLLDDGVRGALAGGYTDKMQKMASGDESVYDELWSYACPKFVTSAPPDWADAGSSYSQEAYRQQLRLFLFEVRAAAPLPGLRAALRLYTTIPVAKLGALLEMDEGRTRALLLAAKRQSTLLEWRQGPALTGVWVTTGDVDWRVDGDVVHCVDCAQPGNVVAFLASAIEHQRLLQASLITPQLAALAAPV